MHNTTTGPSLCKHHRDFEGARNKAMPQGHMKRCLLNILGSQVVKGFFLVKDCMHAHALLRCTQR